MTICLVTDIYAPLVGGIPTFYSYLANNLVNDGHQVLILTLDYSNKNKKEDVYEIANEQLTIIRLNKQYTVYYEHYKPFFRPGGINAPHWLALGFSMRHWLNENHNKYKIDIVEVNDYGGLGFFLMGPDLPPVVLSGNSALHQIQQLSNLNDDDHVKVLKELESLSFKYANAIIAHSNLNKDALEKLTGRSVEYVMAPFELTYSEISNRGNLDPVVVGGLQKIKGAVVMADAAIELKSKNPNISVNWIGYDTYTAPGRKSMSQFLSKNYPSVWQSNLRWLGEKDRAVVLKEIEECSFVIVPSLWETFNYTVLEAADLAKALIITNTTGASSLFTHEYDAIIIESGNSKALADSILLLYNDVEKRNKLGTNARKTLEMHYSNNKSSEERIFIYKKIIDERHVMGNLFEDHILFLEKYCTRSRMRYYKFRSLIKKFIKGNK
ncbi:MAG: glycosyltransferase family 4 protein [Flavisolibacter sp.]